MNGNGQHDPFVTGADARPLYEQVVAPLRYRMPAIARLRVCAQIEPEREVAGGPKFEESLAQRYRALTTKLPLFGSLAMRDGGAAALDALAGRAPWAAPLVGAVEREVRTQLALGRPWVRLEPTLLVGPPGIGKSWIATRLMTTTDLSDEEVAYIMGWSPDEVKRIRTIYVDDAARNVALGQRIANGFVNRDCKPGPRKRSQRR